MKIYIYILVCTFTFSAYADVNVESRSDVEEYKYLLLEQRLSKLEGIAVIKTELLDAQLINNDVKNQVGTMETLYRELLDKQFKYIEALEERLTSHLERQDRSIDIVQDHTESYFGGLTTLLVFVTIFAGFVNVIFTKRSAIEVAREESEVWCKEIVPKKVEELESKYKEDVDCKINSIEESTKQILVEKSNLLEQDFKKTIDEKISHIEMLIKKIEGYERNGASMADRINRHEIQLNAAKEMTNEKNIDESIEVKEVISNKTLQHYMTNFLKAQK